VLRLRGSSRVDWKPDRMCDCWNLLSAARGPTRVNSGDNRVTCSGTIALLISPLTGTVRGYL
jgi:hypothetical protein